MVSGNPFFLFFLRWWQTIYIKFTKQQTTPQVNPQQGLQPVNYLCDKKEWVRNAKSAENVLTN